MSIEAEFQDVRRVYFPQWDREGQWTAKLVGPDTPGGFTAYCDSRAKTIYFREQEYWALPPASSRAFLIHEICHDATTAYHLRPWARRMMSAVKHARRIGEFEVSRYLFRAHVRCYCGNGVFKPCTQGAVIEFVEELPIDVSVHRAIERTANHFGYRPSHIRRKFGQVITEVIEGDPA